MIGILAAIIAGGGSGTQSPIKISTTSYVSTSVFPTGCSTSLTFQSNGDLAASAVSGVPDAKEWHTRNIIAGLGNDWEIFLETVSGTPDSGTVDTWLALSTNRSVGVTGVIGGKTYTFKALFRRVGGSTSYTSATISINAEQIV